MCKHLKYPKNSLRCVPDFLQDADELTQALLADVSELPPVDRGQLAVDLFEQLQPLLGDARRHEPAILASAFPHDEPCRLHPIQQAGDVWDLSHEPLPDFVAA